jgi:hypothetical protein
MENYVYENIVTDISWLRSRTAEPRTQKWLYTRAVVRRLYHVYIPIYIYNDRALPGLELGTEH